MYPTILCDYSGADEVEVGSRIETVKAQHLNGRLVYLLIDKRWRYLTILLGSNVSHSLSSVTLV